MPLDPCRRSVEGSKMVDQQASVTSTPTMTSENTSLTSTGTTSTWNSTVPSTPGSVSGKHTELSIEHLDEALNRQARLDLSTSLSTLSLYKNSGVNNDPYGGWECAFGYLGHVDAPAPVTADKKEFLEHAAAKVKTIAGIQSGFRSYLKAIHSGDYHDFDQGFLYHQSNATAITIAQLNQIADDIAAIVRAVKQSAAKEVAVELLNTFQHGQPWVNRARAILVSAHVFYKVNYVLGSSKKTHVVG